VDDTSGQVRLKPETTGFLSPEAFRERRALVGISIARLCLTPKEVQVADELRGKRIAALVDHGFEQVELMIEELAEGRHTRSGQGRSMVGAVRS
jgi:hypothetical protein